MARRLLDEHFRRSSCGCPYDGVKEREEGRREEGEDGDEGGHQSDRDMFDELLRT